MFSPTFLVDITVFCFLLFCAVLVPSTTSDSPVVPTATSLLSSICTGVSKNPGGGCVLPYSGVPVATAVGAVKVLLSGTVPVFTLDVCPAAWLLTKLSFTFGALITGFVSVTFDSFCVTLPA